VGKENEPFTKEIKMNRHIFAVIGILICIPLSTKAQNDSGRYRIYSIDQVEFSGSNDNSKTLNIVSFFQVNSDKTTLLLDSKTGKTWILTDYILNNQKLSDGRNGVSRTMVWEPILIKEIDRIIRSDESTMLLNGTMKENPSEKLKK
jgi:hypothetical protein